MAWAPAAVVGCGDLQFDEAANTVTINGKVYHEGDCISVDGSTGNVYDGLIPTVEASISGDFAAFHGLGTTARKLHVRTNADTPRDTARLWPSALRASVCAVPSTCSSRPAVSRLCVR